MLSYSQAAEKNIIHVLHSINKFIRQQRTKCHLQVAIYSSYSARQLCMHLKKKCVYHTSLVTLVLPATF